MNHNKEIIENLTKNSNFLDKLDYDVNAVYDLVKQKIKICKAFRVSLIGNQLISLENQLIELNYLVMQHNCNCNIYRDLVSSCDYDPLIDVQVEGLLIISCELQDKYKYLKNIITLSAAGFTPKLIASA